MTLTRGRFVVGAFLLVGLAATGCGKSGPATAHLSGTVTINGQPLPADATGQVLFIPVDQRQAKGISAVITNGRYDSPNTPEGKVKVSFSITQPSGPEYTTDRGVKARNVSNIVPPGVGAGIELEVSGDNSEQNFDLK